jgi:hypothetical protein
VVTFAAGDWPRRFENHEEDRMRKTISALTAAAIFAVSATAFAQVPAADQAPGEMSAPSQEMTPAPAQPPAQPSGVGDEKKPDKPAKGSQTKGKAKAKGHAKKINKKQGDR